MSIRYKNTNKKKPDRLRNHASIKGRTFLFSDCILHLLKQNVNNLVEKFII